MSNTSDISRAVSMLEHGLTIVRQQLTSTNEAGIAPAGGTASRRNEVVSPGQLDGISVPLILGAGAGAGSQQGQPRTEGMGRLITTTTPSRTQPSVPNTTNSRNVIAEWRRSFGPYDLPSGSRGGRRQPLINRSSLTIRQRIWRHRVFCLGGPEDSCTPLALRKTLLQRAELGLRAIHIDSTATPEQFRAEIYKLYPKILGFDFEVLRSVGGGTGKPLMPISPTAPIPEVHEIETVIGTSMLYIRPTSELVLELEIPHGQLVDPTAGTSSTPPIPMPAQDVDFEVLDFLEPAVQSDLVTLKDWRDTLYSSYEGQTATIFVQRDDFAVSILGVYKGSRLDLYKPPEIIFAGEAGADSGALTKEYFWSGISALTTGKYNGRIPFFEGENDSRLPTVDGSLVRSGVFELIGKFFLHCAIHMGIAFIGLSDCFAEYITTEDVNAETPFTISITDIPDQDVREAITLVSLICEMCCPFPPQRMANKFLGFWDTKLLPFVKSKDYLIKGMFPKWKDLSIPTNLIIGKIQCGETNEIVGHVKDFIAENCTDGDLARKLLLAWTAWPDLPENSLKIRIGESDDQFFVRTCFQELVIPNTYGRFEIFREMQRLLENHTGFGLL